MNMLESKELKRAVLAAVAAALTLGLAACGERPSNDKFGQNMERGSNVTPPPNRAAESTSRPDSGMTPRSADASKGVDDATLTNRVKSAITSDSNLKTLTISVDTAGGVVTLKGTADTPENAKKAEQIASSVEGVRTVKNELVVTRG